MLTKLMAAVVMTGALWVAGDSLYREFSTCGQQSGCSSRAQRTIDCCSTSTGCCEVTRSSCCSKTAVGACCDSPLTFCTRTGEVYEGCCCEVVNGQYRCLITGETSDECCCVPILD
jgi:hypothetical protein